MKMLKLLALITPFLFLGCSEGFEPPHSWSSGVYKTSIESSTEFCLYHYTYPEGIEDFYVQVRDTSNRTDLYKLGFNIEERTTSKDSSEMETRLFFNDNEITLDSTVTSVNKLTARQSGVVLTVIQKDSKREIPLIKKCDWTRVTVDEGEYEVALENSSITVTLSEGDNYACEIQIRGEKSESLSFTLTAPVPTVQGDSLIIMGYGQNYLPAQEGNIRSGSSSARGKITPKALPPKPKIFTLDEKEYTAIGIVRREGELWFNAVYDNFYDQDNLYSYSAILNKIK